MVVQVLLSTYNGERYLEALAESLARQDYDDVEILVRDDGSSDRTIDILHELSVRHASITLHLEGHVGFVQSFSRLLKLSSSNAEYLAFCDQDDVWCEDKLSRALELLRPYPKKTPLMYCSRLELVDEQLHHLGYSPLPHQGLSFRNAMVECPLQGCTVVLNRAARGLLQGGLPPQVYSHDWWMYLVISAFGTVVYDDEPRIRYRCHSSNVFGSPSRTIDRLRVRARRFFHEGGTHPAWAQASAFMSAYGTSLDAERRGALRRFIESRRRIWLRLAYACRCDVYRQSRLNTAVLRLLIALDRL